MAQVKKAKKAVEGSILTINFANDEIVAVDFNTLPQEIKLQLALHGLSQKVGDSYASAESVDDAVKAAKRVVEDLTAGNWSVRKAGEGAPRTTLLAEALARIANRTLEEAVEVIEELSEDQQKQLRKDPGVKQAMAQIKLERATAAAKGSESTIASLFS